MNEIVSFPSSHDFRGKLKLEFDSFIKAQSQRFDPKNCLKIDLHCHDLNSDVPDELWGRILNLPETWLKTKKLIKCLKANGCDVFTITNHNNARSCWQQQEKGQDILVGTEFTCFFHEYDLFIHVLAYGFSPEEENVLNEKRGNVYDFLKYAHQQDIPVILPHPLYFYTRNPKIDLSLFEKFAVLFQRFEVLNGQRDQWQSVLTLNWINSLTPEKIKQYAAKHHLNPDDFGVDPEQRKYLSGGSDDHMGIFAGQSGTIVYVDNLQERLKTEKASNLALEAIKQGNMAPYGNVAENQKLNIALLDYFSQVAVNIKDPGLLRMFFHRGELSDKIACFTIGNLLLEIQKHKNTQKFFKFVHEALQGKKPNKLVKWKVKKDYRFCIQCLEDIADSKNQSPEHFIKTVNRVLPQLVHELSLLIIKRIKKSGSKVFHGKNKLSKISTDEITRKFEIPMQVSKLLFGGGSSNSMSGVNVGDIFKSLTFPTMVNLILLGTQLGSTRLLYQNRQFLNDFASHIGKNSHPKKALYLTDTLKDKNGVSNSLSRKLVEIQRANLPIDFLICHDSAIEEPHLHVVKPLTTFKTKDLGEQEFRIPDLMQIAQIFYEGGYDRVICSTEGPMALVALYLKHMFNVPSFFFMHTDWLEFIHQTTDLNVHEIDRIRRFLRFFYSQFHGVFVLNEDHQEWLTSHFMQLDPQNVHLTAHHTEPRSNSVKPIQKQSLFEEVSDDTPVLFFASRISKEKGVFELPDIYHAIKKSIPNVRMVIAGTGPAEKELKQKLPEALYLGWVDKRTISQLYASLDLKIFPTRFDTFGNVILEAFTYGMPVISYNMKGPKSIIQHGKNGYLVNNKEEIAQAAIDYLLNPSLHEHVRNNAYQRSLEYQAEPIMTQFQIDLGLIEKPTELLSEQSVA